MSEQSSKAFEHWYNNNFDMELITSPEDVEQAWWVWSSALNLANSWVCAKESSPSLNSRGCMYYVLCANKSTKTVFLAARDSGGQWWGEGQVKLRPDAVDLWQDLPEMPA